MTTNEDAFPSRKGHEPMMRGQRSVLADIGVKVFVIGPFIALGVFAPIAWSKGWLSPVDLILTAVFYTFACLGATVGYHRYFTHGSFKAKPALRIALAIAGSFALQGGPIDWVADHRRHHKFSDMPGKGDPHSPWEFGTSPWALARGFWHAQMGWMFDRNQTNIDRFAPDLKKDSGIKLVNNLFLFWTALNFALPTLFGGLITGSWWGALSAFFWAGWVRMALLHQVTWSVNSICHMGKNRPFESGDKAANVWILAIPSMGESWHNLHHADQTSARHGVLKGQIDISARVIQVLEKLGWAYDVRWPTQERLAKLGAKNKKVKSQ